MFLFAALSELPCIIFRWRIFILFSLQESLWHHLRSHFRLERVLQCPRCNFVTEFRHHLEYHLRQHLGSKPFNCSHCSYTCVSRSMLNSHMRSHSNEMPFDCPGCLYRTKYRSSLRQHLKKTGHNATALGTAKEARSPKSQPQKSGVNGLLEGIRVQVRV